MKLSAITVAALAAAVGPSVFAADFKVYGIADVTLEAVNSGRQTSGPAIGRRARVSSNSSYVGFTGSADVGPGSAFFQLEYGTNVDAQGDGTSGTNTFSYRDTFVGFQNNYGQIKAGNLTLPIRSISGKFNYNPGSTSISETITLMTGINGTNVGFHSRKQNAVQYTSPTLLGGLTLIVGYGANEEKVTGGAGAKNPHTGAFGAYWEKGPLNVYYAYETREDSNTLNAPNPTLTGNASNADDNRLIFRYDFGQGTRALVGFDRQRVDGSFGAGAAAGTGSVSKSAWTVAASQMIDKHEMIVEYAKANSLSCNGAASAVAGSACAPANVSTTGAKQLGFVYHYFWSKDAMFQAYATRIFNDANASYDFDVNPVNNRAIQSGVQTGARPTGVGIGIRYTF